MSTLTLITWGVISGSERPRDEVNYGVHGTPALKIFSVFFAMGTIAFSFGDTILPEIQVTAAHALWYGCHCVAVRCHRPDGTSMDSGHVD